MGLDGTFKPFGSRESSLDSHVKLCWKLQMYRFAPFVDVSWVDSMMSCGHALGPAWWLDTVCTSIRLEYIIACEIF